MENVIKKALVQFPEHNHVLRCLPLLSHWQVLPYEPALLTRTLDKTRYGGKLVHATYIEFKKAFESVPHQRLLHKLRSARFRGNRFL
ncbi:unnamed protein product [Dibothriocephalus latus]|uniref:Reverse transcriptase domain-containing protein n=1 Tax=Dibothriocephalus latus TaxID=60516 RepID=A0A3P7N8J7_DIBLA|nr:unnamed protein product [Dibothriocephalus latus]